MGTGSRRVCLWHWLTSEGLRLTLCSSVCWTSLTSCSGNWRCFPLSSLHNSTPYLNYDTVVENSREPPANVVFDCSFFMLLREKYFFYFFYGLIIDNYCIHSFQHLWSIWMITVGQMVSFWGVVPCQKVWSCVSVTSDKDWNINGQNENMRDEQESFTFLKQVNKRKQHQKWMNGNILSLVKRNLYIWTGRGDEHHCVGSWKWAVSRVSSRTDHSLHTRARQETRVFVYSSCFLQNNECVSPCTQALAGVVL